AQRGCRVILTGGGGDEWLGVSPLMAADFLARGNLAAFRRLLSSMGRFYPCSLSRLIRLGVWNYGLRPILRAGAVRVLPRAWPSRPSAYWRARARRQIPSWLAPDPEVRRPMEERLAASCTRDEQRRQQAGGYYAYDARHSLDHPLVGIIMEEQFHN